MQKRILIVEDHRTSAEYLAVKLKAEKYLTAIAEDGSRAIYLLQKFSFNIVLLDLELPDITGIEILETIRKKYSLNQLPVIVISSITDEKKIITALELGANDFIAKPYTEITLKIKIRNLLQLQEADEILRKTIDEKEVLLKQQSTLFETLPMSAFIVDENNMLLNVNKTASLMFNFDWENGETTFFGNIFGCNNVREQNIVCGTQSSCKNCVLNNAIRETFATKTGVLKREGTFRIVVNNQEVELSILISTTFLVDSEKPSVLLMLDDITNEKQAEIIIKKSHDRLKELNSTKDKFFSIIAHDLKSPFNSLLGFSSLLLKRYEKYDDAKRIEFIILINELARNTSQLLENLLTWSRSQSNKITYFYEQLSMNELVEETLELNQHTAKKKSIHIFNTITNDVMVYADKNTILTVLRNLLSNALKFTPRNGSITIWSTTSYEANPEYVEINIEDTGVGMSKETISKLFYLDKNISTLGTDEEKGTGLGLVLCKDFIENNGGKLRVESVQNEGSTFTFTLPIRKRE